MSEAGLIDRRPFGSGEAEIPSSAIISALAAAEDEERRRGRILVGELVLGVLTLAAVSVAVVADLWLEWAF